MCFIGHDTLTLNIYCSWRLQKLNNTYNKACHKLFTIKHVARFCFNHTQFELINSTMIVFIGKNNHQSFKIIPQYLRLLIRRTCKTQQNNSLLSSLVKQKSINPEKQKFLIMTFNSLIKQY